jgi:hypothetical protein
MNTTLRVEITLVKIIEQSAPVAKEGMNPKTGLPYNEYLPVRLSPCDSPDKSFTHNLWLDDDGCESIDMANLRTYVPKELSKVDIEKVVEYLIENHTPIVRRGRFIAPEWQLKNL